MPLGDLKNAPGLAPLLSPCHWLLGFFRSCHRQLGRFFLAPLALRLRFSSLFLRLRFFSSRQDTGLPSSTGGPQWEPLTGEKGREAGKSGFVGPLIRVSAFAEQVKLDHIAFVG